MPGPHDHALRQRGVVVANSSTTFEPADSSGTIAAGTAIEAHGTRNSTGQLVATRVAIHDDEESGRHGRGRRVGGEGTIGSVSGTCPRLVMIVRGFRVHTNSSTAFENGVCGDIRPGTKAEIQGETRDDGGLTATSVRIIERSHGGGH